MSTPKTAERFLDEVLCTFGGDTKSLRIEAIVKRDGQIHNAAIEEAAKCARHDFGNVLGEILALKRKE